MGYLLHISKTARQNDGCFKIAQVNENVYEIIEIVITSYSIHYTKLYDFGDGLGNLPLADRATLGNMSPEFGSTCAIFPIDEETLSYLRFTGRSDAHIDLVERYARAQGLFHEEDQPAAAYSDHVELDLV